MSCAMCSKGIRFPTPVTKKAIEINNVVTQYMIFRVLDMSLPELIILILIYALIVNHCQVKYGEARNIMRILMLFISNNSVVIFYNLSCHFPCQGTGYQGIHNAVFKTWHYGYAIST